MYTQSNALRNQTVENSLAKAYVIANSAPLTSETLASLYALYEADTSYGKLLEKFTNDTNALLAANGGVLKATVKQLVKNATGIEKTDSQIDALITQYTAKGIDSWAKLYSLWITDTSDEIAVALVSTTIKKVSPLFPNSTLPMFSAKVSMDENIAVGTQIYDATVDSGDESVTYTLLSSSGIDHLPFAIDTATGKVTLAAPLNYDAPTDFGADNIYNFAIRAAGAGGTADQNVQLTIQDVAGTAPVTPAQPATNSTTPSVAENTPVSTVLYDAAVKNDIGVKYTLMSGLSVVDDALFTINEQTGEVTFKASPNYEAPSDKGGNNIYNFAVRALDSATGTRISDTPITLTVTDVTTGDLDGAPVTPPGTTPVAATPPKGSVIDLGAYGKLIAPVQVNNNWYYAWDMNGDGVHNSTQILTGKYMPNGAIQNAAGTKLYVEDRASHDIIDALFNKTDPSGTAAVGGTTDTIRFATLNTVQVALPKAGLSITSGYMPNNAVYQDLAEIWDTYNTTSVADGTPVNWYDAKYLSATASSNGHVMMAMADGFVLDYVDSVYGYVALQVI